MAGFIDVQLWLAFVAASAAMAVLPGPVIAMIVACSLAHGVRTGFLAIAGVICGNSILFALGGFGLAWVLTLLTDWFDVLRWAGAAWLIYTGFRQWRAPVLAATSPESLAGQTSLVRRKDAIFAQGFIVAVTNPKVIVFYAAFFPQFIDPDLPPGTQLIVLGITFIVVVNSIDILYVLLADRLRPWLASERRQRMRNRVTGALLMGVGGAMALARY